NLAATSDCAACRDGERLWLDGTRGSHTTILCGRNAVQVAPRDRSQVILDELARRLSGSGKVTTNPFLVKLTLQDPDYELTVFKDGRAIIKGTEDIATARGVYARYIGT
ncbi:MAG: thiazole biosynthesis adenylyltransferase ThiF, partial [Maioricimonas sp. JB049]